MTDENYTLLNNRIFLFDVIDEKYSNMNPLKEFINFLKTHHQKKVIEFCYSCATDSLHPQLSVKENFILDAVPKSLIRDGEDNFKQFLLTLKNPYLKELIFFIQDLNQKVKDLSKEQVKLVSIIKSLLAQSEYIFLLAPDKNLKPEALELIKKSIEFEVYKRFRSVLIRPENRDLWLDISGHIISKAETDYKFTCIENPLLKKSHKKISTLLLVKNDQNSAA
jgi:ABC-type branched-subunit amino acid transport system ATPase component